MNSPNSLGLLSARPWALQYPSATHLTCWCGSCWYALHSPAHIFRAYDALFFVLIVFYTTMRKHGPCRLDLSFVLSGDIVLLRKFGTTRSRGLLALGDGSHFLLRWLSPIIVLAEAITQLRSELTIAFLTHELGRYERVVGTCSDPGCRKRRFSFN